MNRILLESLDQNNFSDSDSDSDHDIGLQHETVESDPAGFTLLAPLHYEANYAYPLLVWLHPEGENDAHIKQVMPQVSLRNYVAVAPRGTRQLPPGAPNASGPTFTWRQTEDDIILAQQRVLYAVEQARKRFHVHPERIFLAGASCGGTMAFRVAMRFPELFAGVISLGGSFPAGHAPLMRLMDARRLPVFVAAGRRSPRYSQPMVCENLRLFHTAGMCVTLRLYPGTADVNELVLADIDRWIMEVIAGDKATAVVAK
jgi:phospholipase/carboxylesterase